MAKFFVTIPGRITKVGKLIVNLSNGTSFEIKLSKKSLLNNEKVVELEVPDGYEWSGYSDAPGNSFSVIYFDDKGAKTKLVAGKIM